MTYEIEIIEPRAQKLLEELVNLNLIKFIQSQRIKAKEQISNAESYPYRFSIIQFDDFIYLLNNKIECFVAYEEDSYKIKNESLDIVVWGDTREEAELAFAFNFHALYENFALEDDSKLSLESKNLKNKLLKLVKTVLHETEKN